MERIGRYTLRTQQRPWVESYGAVGGKQEAEGPLGAGFDRCFFDTTMGKATWEQAESAMQNTAVQLALQKARLSPEDLDITFAGDLVNQCTASTFGLRGFSVPFLGQYGACSTMGQALLMAAIFAESGAAKRALAVTSSHFCTAERQFRFPLEYGGQRPQTSQWTATAAGAVVVASETVAPRPQASGVTCQMESHRVQIAHVLPGRMVDLGIKDMANMGAAMAPAAACTLADFFEDTGTKPADYDCIVTGDLGQVGSTLLRELLSEQGVALADRHMDCGLLLFDRKQQDVHAGGSGCGCAASVLCAKILPEMEQGLRKEVLFLPTGALLSTTSGQQGESIPGIAHLVHLTSVPACP